MHNRNESLISSLYHYCKKNILTDKDKDHIADIITAIKEMMDKQSEILNKYNLKYTDNPIEPINIFDSTFDHQMQTPLIQAALNGHLELVTALVELKATVDLQSKHGDTALIAATCNNHSKIVSYLLKAKASLDIQNLWFENRVGLFSQYYDIQHLNQTALIVATNEKNLDIVTQLVEAKAELDIQDHLGNTALITAAWDNQNDIANTLIECKANLELYRKDRRTALDVAVEFGHTSMVYLLLNMGALIKNPAALLKCLKDSNRAKLDEIKYCLQRLHEYQLANSKIDNKNFILDNNQHQEAKNYLNKLKLLENGLFKQNLFETLSSATQNNEICPDALKIIIDYDTILSRKEIPRMLNFSCYMATIPDSDLSSDSPERSFSLKI